MAYSFNRTVSLISILFVALSVPFIFYYLSTSKEKSINILAWGGVLESKNLAKEFYEETGIKINLSFYSTNEELLAKFKAKGGQDYDLLMPSGYMVKKLKKDKLIKKLEKSKLNFIDRIEPLFMGHKFDLNNEYSVPFIWENLGFARNKKMLELDPSKASLKWVFEEPKNFKIILRNDPVELVFLGALFLYDDLLLSSKNNCKNNCKLNKKQIKEIEQLLIRQNSWTEAYVNFRSDYLLTTKQSPLALIYLGDFLRAASQSSDVEFIIPKDVTIFSIENFVISSKSSKDDSIYKFLNFVYRVKNLNDIFESFDMIPATKDFIYKQDSLKKAKIIDLIKHLSKNQKNREKILFISKLIPEDKLHNLWIRVKS